MGLQPILNLWAGVLRRVALTYYRAALKGMQKQGKATHPDVPEIIRAIRRLEQ